MIIKDKEKNSDLHCLPKLINLNIEPMISLIQRYTNYLMKYKYRIELNILICKRILMRKSGRSEEIPIEHKNLD